MANEMATPPESHLTRIKLQFCASIRKNAAILHVYCLLDCISPVSKYAILMTVRWYYIISKECRKRDILFPVSFNIGICGRILAGIG